MYQFQTDIKRKKHNRKKDPVKNQRSFLKKIPNKRINPI